MASQGSRVVFVGPDTTPCLLFEKNVNLPQISQGQILARIRLATICGSDIHTIQGTRKEATPSILGHEAVAEVVVNKRSGCTLEPGDRITFSIMNSCQTCAMCDQNGLPQKCISLTKIGHMPISQTSSFNGCFASHIILETGTAVFKVPDKITDLMAAPINCALATMVNTVQHIPDDSKYKTALIQGAGLLGVYGCALLKERGFANVFCTDIDPKRLLFLSKFGGIPVDSGLPGSGQTLQPGTVDVVIEVCGVKDVLQKGIESLRIGGLYLLVGLVHPNSKLDITGEQLIRKCLTVTGIHNYRPQDLEYAVNFMGKTCDKYPYEYLVSKPFELKDIVKAVKSAESRNYWRVAVKS